VLTAWSAAALVGPNLIASLRQSSYDDAVVKLVTMTPDESFMRTFGTGKENVPALIEAKSLTIPRLMEIVPPGTVDPTPMLYSSAMYSIAGLLAVAMLANVLIQPVDAKHHMQTKAVESERAIDTTATEKEKQPSGSESR
jgi:hypothetical protein